MKQIGLPFFLVGVIFIVVGIYVLTNGANKSKRCTVETVGMVVEIKEERTTDSEGDYQYTYYPVIRYQAGDRTITKQRNRSI